MRMISLPFLFQSPGQFLSLPIWRREWKKMRIGDDWEEKASTMPREALCLPSVPNEWQRLRRVGYISKVFILPKTLRDYPPQLWFILTHSHPLPYSTDILSLSLPLPLRSQWFVSVSGPWCPVSPQLWYLIIVTTDSVTSISSLFRSIIYKAAVT